MATTIGQWKAAQAAAAGALLLMSMHAVEAHHSAAMFDTDTPVSVNGIVLRIERNSPHIYMYVQQETADGPVEWAIEGPAPRLLAQRGTSEDAVTPGDIVDACGYRLKESNRGPAGIQAQVLVAEVVVLADGDARLWSGYGNSHCRQQERYTVPAD